ncbi:MAG: hypothetical protein QW531_03215 [Thermoplasmata archaeon]
MSEDSSLPSIVIVYAGERFPTRNDLLKDYSVHDVLWTLSKIYVVELEGARVLNEIPKTAQKLLENLRLRYYLKSRKFRISSMISSSANK